MDIIISKLGSSWSNLMTCDSCLASLSKSQLKFHSQYCPNSHSPRFNFPSEDYSLLQTVVRHKIHKLKLSSFKIQRELGSFPSNEKKNLQNQYLTELSQISALKTKCEKWSKANQFSYKAVQEVQELLLFAIPKELTTFSKFLGDSTDSYEMIEKKFSIDANRKVNEQSCTYSEDENYLVLTDNTQIRVFNKNTAELIFRATDNLSSNSVILNEFGYILYQNKFFEIVLLDFKNNLKEIIYSLKPQQIVNYLKISKDSKFLVGKLVKGSIFVLDISNKVLVKVVEDSEGLNFVIKDSSCELFIFDSNIFNYDFRFKSQKVLGFRNKSRVDCLIVFDNDKFLAVFDAKSFKIIRSVDFSLVFTYNNQISACYLTKDHKYLCTYNSSCFDLALNSFTNSISFAGKVNNNLFEFVPFTSSNIFHNNSVQQSQKEPDYALKLIIESCNFLAAENYTEKYVINSGSLFAVYYNKTASKVFTWDLDSCKKFPELQNFSPDYKHRFINQDYLIMSSESFYYFWSFKTRMFESCVLSKNVIEKSQGLTKFSFSRNGKYSVLPNKGSMKFVVFKMKLRNRVFHSDASPVLDTDEKLIGVVNHGEIKLMSIENSQYMAGFSLNGFFGGLGYRILASKFILLVFHCELLVVCISTGELLGRKPIFYIPTLESLQIVAGSKYAVVKNSTEIILISLLEQFNVSVIELAPLNTIQSLRFVADSQYLVALGSTEIEFVKGLTSTNYSVFLINLETLNVQDRFDSENEFYVNDFKEFLVFIQPKKLIVYRLIKFKKTELSFMRSVFFSSFFEGKYISLLQSDILTVIQLGEELKQVKYVGFKSSYQIDISKSEEFFFILKENTLDIYDRSLENLVQQVKFQKIKYNKLLVLDETNILLYNETQNFLILDFIKNIKIHNFAIKEKVLKIAYLPKTCTLHLAGTEFFAQFQLSTHLFIQKKSLFTQLTENHLFYKPTIFETRILNLITGKESKLNHEDKELSIFYIAANLNKIILFNSKHAIGYIEQF